jgi:hypothetical protein
MEDQTADCNKRVKATMRDENSTNLNSSGKAGVVVKSPMQAKNAPKNPSRHVDPYTGKRS